MTATFAPRAAVPIAVLRSWIDESCRAVAPRRLVAGLAPRSASPRVFAPRRGERATRR